MLSREDRKLLRNLVRVNMWKQAAQIPGVKSPDIMNAIPAPASETSESSVWSNPWLTTAIGGGAGAALGALVSSAAKAGTRGVILSTILSALTGAGLGAVAPYVYNYFFVAKPPLQDPYFKQYFDYAQLAQQGESAREMMFQGAFNRIVKDPQLAVEFANFARRLGLL